MKNVGMTHGKKLRSNGKEMYKNEWCTCLAIVLLICTLLSSSSDVKREVTCKGDVTLDDSQRRFLA